jgi:uncharacterized protein YcfL
MKKYLAAALIFMFLAGCKADDKVIDLGSTSVTL